MRKIKITAIIAALMTMAFIFTGCGSASLARPSADVSKIVKVSNTCTMKIENKKATLECKTDMMDGTVFKLSVSSPSAVEIKSAIITKNGDNLKAVFDLPENSEQYYYGFAVSAPSLYGSQPDAVIAKYGKKFENIDSKDILWNGDSNVLTVTSGKVNTQ